MTDKNEKNPAILSPASTGLMKTTASLDKAVADELNKPDPDDIAAANILGWGYDAKPLSFKSGEWKVVSEESPE